MIFYFSGTGNSRLVAERLAWRLKEETVPILDTDASSISVSGKYIGFVFPVYSWGVPPNVAEFIKKLPDCFLRRNAGENMPVWSVMTCGDETGNAPKMMQNIFRCKGWKIKGIWSVIMPNNYVILPGFDVDPSNLALRKLEEAPKRIDEIADNIVTGNYTIDCHIGSWPGLKTGVIYPLFKKWGIFPKKWHSTDACVGCGICVRNCPVNNMKMLDGRPSWGKNCVSCLACYHSCPRHCVEYGKATGRKGQYYLQKEYISNMGGK